MSWIDEAPRDVVRVARELGLDAQAPRGASGGAIGPCPSCSATKRHPTRRDRRLSCGVRADRLGWRCYECDVSGDALDLAAWVVAGRRFRDLDASARERVRDRLGAAPTSTQAAPQPPVPSYPPGDALASLWASCVPVLDDRDVAAYLAARGIDPVNVADRDLARSLGHGPLPSWASIRGVPWSSSGHRLVVPMFDACGRMRSALARRVVDGETPKSIAPAGYTRAGLLLACPLAQRLLESGRPAWWRLSQPRLRVVVSEGEIDFLTAASRTPDGDEHAYATLGIGSGAWTSEAASRIPDGVELVIATDPDDAGERYAAQVVASMSARPRVGLARWRPAA